MSLESLITNYQPSAETQRLISENPPVLVTGVSGAGKNYLIDQLVKTGKYGNLVTCTTRLPRENDGVLEQDGLDYYFIDLPKAQLMLEEQDFIEAKFVHGNVYGSSVAEYKRVIGLGKTPIADIDVQGVAEYKKNAPDTKAIFVLPPSYEVWMERLKKRFKSESEFLQVWPKRRDSSIKELEFALSSHLFEWVINGASDSVVISAERVINLPTSAFVTAEQKQLAKNLLEELKNDQI